MILRRHPGLDDGENVFRLCICGNPLLWHVTLGKPKSVVISKEPGSLCSVCSHFRDKHPEVWHYIHHVSLWQQFLLGPDPEIEIEKEPNPIWDRLIAKDTI